MVLLAQSQAPRLDVFIAIARYNQLQSQLIKQFQTTCKWLRVIVMLTQSFDLMEFIVHLSPISLQRAEHGWEQTASIKIMNN